MATCGNKVVSALQTCLITDAGHQVLAWLDKGQHRGKLGLGKKGNLFLPTTHSYFRTGTTQAPPQACRKLKEPSLGCSPTLYLPPNTDQNVLSAQGPVPGPGPVARISV